MATPARSPMSTAPIPTATMKCHGAVYIAAATDASVAATVPPDRFTDEQFAAEVMSCRLLMRSVATRIVGRQEADDIVAEALRRAWQFRTSYDGRAKISTWLMAITRNTGLEHHRFRTRRPQRPSDPDGECGILESLISSTPDPEQLAYAGEIYRAFDLSVSRLPEHLHDDFCTWLTDRSLGNDPTRKVHVFRAKAQVIHGVRRQLGIANDNRGPHYRAGAGSA